MIILSYDYYGSGRLGRGMEVLVGLQHGIQQLLQLIKQKQSAVFVQSISVRTLKVRWRQGDFEVVVWGVGWRC
jgi:hypothetical protein